MAFKTLFDIRQYDIINRWSWRLKKKIDLPMNVELK